MLRITRLFLKLRSFIIFLFSYLVIKYCISLPYILHLWFLDTASRTNTLFRTFILYHWIIFINFLLDLLLFYVFIWNLKFSEFEVFFLEFLLILSLILFFLIVFFVLVIYLLFFFYCSFSRRFLDCLRINLVLLNKFISFWKLFGRGIMRFRVLCFR